MTTLVTKDQGATAKPQGALYVEPDLQTLDAGSQTALAGSGLDPAFFADLLSGCLAHERCGVHLYRSVATRTAMEQLRERYEHFGEETLRHVELLEELIVESGGNAAYVSPSARASEAAASALLESTFLTGGSVDLTTAELAMLEAVVLAEAKDRANWELLSLLAAQMSDADLKASFQGVCDEVLTQELEHFGWARSERERLLFSLATGGLNPPPTTAIPERRLAEMSRDDLYAHAQELGIEGRSQMTKDQLIEAITATGRAAKEES